METVELALTSRRRAARRSGLGCPAPVGDGPQLCEAERPPDRLLPKPGELPALGVDMARMAAVARC